MPSIKTLLIGCGGIANAHMNAIGENIEQIELAAAVDIDEARATAFAEKHGIAKIHTDVEKALASVSPELVLIATPPFTHANLIIQSLRAGAWVLCEKPLVGSLADLDRVQEAEKATGNRCASVFQMRYGSAGRHLKRIVDEKLAGRALVAIANTVWYRPPSYFEVSWRGKWETEFGGPTVGHGIHTMDLLLFILGPWKSVQAQAHRLARDVVYEDTSLAHIVFQSGAVATITNSLLCPRQETYLRIDCELATIEANYLYSLANEDLSFTTPDRPNDALQPDDITEEMVKPELLASLKTLPAPIPSNHAAQLTEFIADFRHDRSPITSGEHARGTIEFLSAIYKSAFTGDPVSRGSIQPGDPFYQSLHGSHIL